MYHVSWGFDLEAKIYMNFKWRASTKLISFNEFIFVVNSFNVFIFTLAPDSCVCDSESHRNMRHKKYFTL